MNRIKNQHLLVGVILLSALSTVLCLALVVSERSNSTRLEKLQTELNEAREQNLTVQRQLGDGINDVKHAVSQLANTLTAQIESVRSEQQMTRKDVSDLDRDLKSVKAKLTPLDLKLKDLESRLAALEKPPDK